MEGMLRLLCRVLVLSLAAPLGGVVELKPHLCGVALGPFEVVFGRMP
jgi:hypothetical protein